MKLVRYLLAALALVFCAEAKAQTLGSVTTQGGNWPTVVAPDINDDLTKIYGTPVLTIGNQTTWSTERGLAVAGCVSGTDGGAGGAYTINLVAACIDAALLGTDSVSADELNAAGVESELEAVLDVADLQGFSAVLTEAEAAAAYQPLDADLTTWAGLMPSANAQSLVTAANYAAMRALLDLEAGTDFYSKTAADAAFQPLDADLTAIAGITWNQGDILYYNGSTLVDLAPGTNGQFLKTRGAGNDPIWDDAPGAGGGISNVSEDTDPELGGALDTAGFAIEFGNNQTDTSVVRSAAGIISVEGVDIVTLSASQTLTNKSIAATQITAGALNIGNNAATVGTVELANGTSNTLSASGGTLSIEGVALATAASVTNKTESFCFAMSDETTDLTASTNKIKFRMPYAFTVTAVRASLSTAATGANLLTVDLNESGSTILSTKLTFDASETTTTTAATPAVISDSSLADDAEISGDIDQIGNSTAGRGLKVCIIGHQ